MNIMIKEILFGSKEYDDEIMLRYKVLREPLHLTYTKEQLDEEKDQIRIAAFEDNVLVGCILIKALPGGVAQFRQAAVKPLLQGKGIGALLMQYAERLSQQNGFNKVLLHARKYAIPFYEKYGYTIVSQEYLEVGIPHQTMMKDLKAE